MRGPASEPDGLFKRLSSLLPDGLVRTTSWGMLDQAIISGTNFLATILAARILGPSAFGVFALLLTILYLMESTQRSLITTPHNVFGVSKSVSQYVTYTSSALAIQIAVALVFFAVSSLGAGIIMAFDAGTAPMVAAMALAALAWQIQEFTRRVLYTESRISTAAAVDGLTYITRLASLAALISAGALSGVTLLLLYAGTWFLGSLAGLYCIRGSLSRSFDRSIIAEHWRFGRWLFASNSVSHLPRYVVAAMLSSVLSVAAYGAYRAFEQLANGANVPLTAISNVLRPRLAREAQKGAYAVWKIMLPVMLLGGGALILFALAFITFRNPLVDLIFGAEYVEFTAAVYLVALLPFLLLQKSMLTKALQAFHNTRSIFVGTVAGAAVGSLGGSSLILLFGLPVAGAIMVLSGVVSTAWIGWTWSKHLTGEERWPGEIQRTSNLIPPR